MKVGDILIARASVMMVKYSRESDELFIIGGKGYRISLIEEKDGDIEYIYINSEHTNEHCINYNSIEHYFLTLKEYRKQKLKKIGATI